MPNAHPPAGPKTLVITGPARADIDGQLAHIARESGLEAALRFADKIDGALAKLAWLGHGGASREWLAPGLRLSVLGHHCIYFRVSETETRILRFLRGARDTGEIDFGAEEP